MTPNQEIERVIMGIIKYITGPALAAGVTMIVIQYVSTPVVVISHSTGQCVKVISEQGEDSCTNLPEKYIKEWSE